MDNKEIDKVLKEKLNDKIKPTEEFERKVAIMVEKEKNARLSAETTSKSKFKKIENTKKAKSYRYIPKILSMAAVVVVVFTLGINLRTTPNIGDESGANLVSIKAIEPTKLESGILAGDSEFTIYVEGDNINTEAVQKSIYVEPALDYIIEKTLNKNEYKLRFKQNIPDNTIVKLQYVKNQITEDSWAYQTSNKLSVVTTYPDNNAEDVSKKSVIDIELSYASVENFEKYVKITPTTKGNWEHLGKVWRFTPSVSLNEETKYTVTISKELTADEQKLGEDYKFTFRVNEEGRDKVKYYGISIDGIVNSKPNEAVKIPYNTNNFDIKFGKVEISRFANIDDFIEYIKDNNPEKAIKQGEYEIKATGGNYKGYLEFKQSLGKGYYVAKINNNKGNELFNCPIQISDISAYAMETERDVLVWVAQNNDLAANINVEYQEKTIKTNSQGIAKFEGIADGSETIKYAKIANELVVGIYNYYLDKFPSAYIYTDRPLYKNTDTINIWGFVPKSLFYEKVEDEFYIELGEEGKQKVNVGEDGNFNFKLDLKNHIDTQEIGLSLYYKDISIANRYIAIQNYELQNYTYDVIADKNYGLLGETIEFDVKVKHITGLVVPNKKVMAIYREETYRATTGEDGIAHFKIKLTGDDSRRTSPIYQEIEIYNGDETEYTTAESYFTVRMLTRNTYTKFEDKDYTVTLYKLATDRKVQTEYDLKELYNGTYETTVDVNLIEEETTWVQDREEYNEYTKQMEPHYISNTIENTIKIKTVKSTNGVVNVSDNEIKKKEDTDDKSYSYAIELKYKDLNKKEVRETISVYEEWYNKEEFGYRAEDGIDGSDSRVYEIPSSISEDYFTYRYLWKDDASKFTSGEKANFTLAEATKNGIKDIENNGKVLNIFFKEEILVNDIITGNSFSREFTNDDFPGFKMTSAYFIDGKFYRMPVRYFDFDEENKKVDIEITPDKEQYKPGDTVTLNIKTTKGGKAIKSFVNVSVVNEAVFEIEEDTTNLLERIYSDKSYAVYTYSSYIDDILSLNGGEGGGFGGPRANFGDTAHFETVYTNRNGDATVTFKLPDNVTTYRVTAQSANEDLELGVNTKQITSKLDFFIQSVQPRGVKTEDDVVLNATAIADTKYDVDYEFTIKELNKTLTAKGKTNNLVTVNFGKLPYGSYTAVIKGKHDSQEDAIEYKFKVVVATQEVSNKTTININSEATIKPSKNPIVLEIYNKNMEKYVQYIDFIENTLTERLDTQIAYNKAQEIKDKYYGTDNYSINSIDMYLYQGERYYLKNLRNGKDDIVLTALVSYYAKDYSRNVLLGQLNKEDNLFEYYLLLAARQESVLQDLLYLKEEKETSNYNKLLLTLALEFTGDYTNAKDLYSSISLSEEEAKEYKSLVCIIETFIRKDGVTNKIDDLIENSPSDEYLRFAILSFFQNNSNEIGKEETVKVKIANSEETVTLNGMQIKSLTLNNEQLEDISFDTESQDLMVSYYYQTLLENISSKNIKKDIKATISGDMKVGNTLNLKIDFNGDYEGEVRIALPNSLRLSKAHKEFDSEAKYYIQSNRIDYITLYKTKKCKTISLPLLIINSGSYKFENIVCNINGVYHISNSIDLKIK